MAEEEWRAKDAYQASMGLRWWGQFDPPDIASDGTASGEPRTVMETWPTGIIYSFSPKGEFLQHPQKSWTTFDWADHLLQHNHALITKQEYDNLGPSTPLGKTIIKALEINKEKGRRPR